MVAAGIGLILGASGKAPGVEREKAAPASEIVRTAAQILVPLISIFAAYIIMNGHISAGGGFQGGAVLASAMLLMFLANPSQQSNFAFVSMVESIAGVLFVLVGIAGLMFAAAFSTAGSCRSASSAPSSAPAPFHCCQSYSASKWAAN